MIIPFLSMLNKLHFAKSLHFPAVIVGGFDKEGRDPWAFALRMSARFTETAIQHLDPLNMENGSNTLKNSVSHSLSESKFWHVKMKP